ncbi:hypothetical protein C6569_18705 [Phreatobacter cathodiphilus]|uniref:Uncharacterized protein n=1 Tax=Phreatobacter cathodiphilus TaxID=1868589 RepID=A0A2S0NFG4_9HYPH|nr:hypothetical protein C6569_18705 [Phreatobacter cathodiphilus]
MDPMVLLARLVGNGIDPMLLIPALLLGWLARGWGEVVLAAFLVAGAVTGILALIVSGTGRQLPWVEVALLKLVAAFIWAAAARGVKHLVGRRQPSGQ